MLQPELFVRSVKVSLDDVLSDPGTTMRAIATEMVVPTYCTALVINVDKNMLKPTVNHAGQKRQLRQYLRARWAYDSMRGKERKYDSERRCRSKMNPSIRTYCYARCNHLGAITMINSVVEIYQLVGDVLDKID